MHSPAGRSGRLFANFAYLSTGHLVAKGTAVIALAITARYLGETEFGQFSFALATVMLVEVTNDLGLSQAIARDAAAEPARLSTDPVAALPIKVTMAGLSVGFAAAVAVVAGAPSDLIGVTAFLAISRAIASLTQFVRAIFEGAERMEYEAASTAFEGVVRLALTVYALLSGFGLLGLAKAYVVASVIVLVATTTIALRRFMLPFVPKIDWGRGPELLRAGIPFGAYYFLSGFTLRADTVLLLPLAGSLATARFAGAVRIVEPALVIVFIYSIAVLPLAARHHSTGFMIGRQLLGSTQKVLFLVSTLIVLIAWAGGEELITVILGPGFEQALWPFRLLSLALVSLFAKEGLARVLLAARRERALLIAQVATVLANLLLAVILIPMWGAIGAAVAVLVAEAFGTILAGIGVLDLLHHHRWGPVRPVLVFSIAFLAALLASGSVPVVREFVAVVSYVIGLVVIRPFSQRELQYLRSNATSLLP